MTIRFQELGEFVPDAVIETRERQQFAHVQGRHFGEGVKAILGCRFFKSIAERQAGNSL